MSTKQLRQAITPTHILGSTGVAEGSDLGYQSIPNFAANIQPELRATQGEAQTGTGNDKFLTPLRVRDVFVGTVSQSGGVPTGAIIEYGSNVNGKYVRYAGGAQICTSAPLFTTGQSHTYPASFIGAPSVGMSLAATSPRFATHSTPTNTDVTVYIWDNNGNSATGSVRIFTIGSWF